MEPRRKEPGKSHLWIERPSLGLSSEMGTAQGQPDMDRQWGLGTSTRINDLLERRIKAYVATS